MGGIALFGLSACGEAGGGGEEGSDEGTYTGQQAVAHLDEIISAATFKIAEAKGYFADEKLKVESVSFPGGGDVVRAIQTKMALGQPAVVPTLIAHQKALKDIRIIGGSFYDPEVVFTVKKGSPLKSPKDLKGKKIGVSEPGSNSTYFATELIRTAGFEPGKDVKIVSVGGPSDASTAVEQGVVDVGWSTPPLITKEIQEGKKQIFIEANEIEPKWLSVCLVTRQPFIESNPKVVQRWIDAIAKAQDLIHTNPKDAGQAWGKSIEVDPEVTSAALEKYKDAFSIEIDRDAIAANIEAGKKLGQIEGDPDLEEIIEEKFLPAGARS